MFEGLFQPMHLLVIFAIALLLFGPKKIGDIGKGLGEAIRGFKQAMNEEPPAKASSQASSSQPAKDPETKPPAS